MAKTPPSHTAKDHASAINGDLEILSSRSPEIVARQSIMDCDDRNTSIA